MTQALQDSTSLKEIKPEVIAVCNTTQIQCKAHWKRVIKSTKAFLYQMSFGTV